MARLSQYIQQQKRRGVGNIQSFQVEYAAGFLLYLGCLYPHIWGLRYRHVRSREVWGNMAIGLLYLPLYTYCSLLSLRPMQ